MFVIKEKKILKERASDLAYAKITEIIFKHLSRSKVWKADIHQDLIMPDSSYAEQVYAVVNPTTNIVNDIWAELDASLSDKEKITLNDIFPDPSYLSKVLFELKIWIRPREHNPAIGGSMDKYGNMTLYPHYWSKAKNQNDPNAIKTINLLNSGTFFDKHIKSTFTHEFAHYLNAIRSATDLNNYYSRATYRSKGGKNQFNVDKKEYAQSTEELQARLTDIFTIIQGALNKTDIKIVGPEEQYILYMLAAKDFKTFIKYFETPYMYAYNKKLVDSKYIYRVKSRLYSAFMDFAEQKSIIKDYAKKNPKLFNTKYNFKKFTELAKEFEKKVDKMINSIINNFTALFKKG